MKTFLIIFGIIIAYIFIGVLYYWISILIDYKKSKTKRPLHDWLNETCDEVMNTREDCYLYSSIFWIISLPMNIIMTVFGFIIYLFSNIIKNILKINKLDGRLLS